MNELLKNGSGYWDGVAYEAMMSLEKKKEVKTMLDIRRGDVVEYTTKVGKEILAVVVSADKYNNDDNHLVVVTCIFTDKNTSELCVPFQFRDKKYINCGSICVVYKKNIYNIVKTLKENELVIVDEMLMKSLSLSPDNGVKCEKVVLDKVQELKDKIATLEREKTQLIKVQEELNERNNQIFDDNVKYENEIMKLKDELSSSATGNVDIVRIEAERDIYKELYFKAMELK